MWSLEQASRSREGKEAPKEAAKEAPKEAKLGFSEVFRVGVQRRTTFTYLANHR